MCRTHSPFMSPPGIMSHKVSFMMSQRCEGCEGDWLWMLMWAHVTPPPPPPPPPPQPPLLTLIFIGRGGRERIGGGGRGGRGRGRGGGRIGMITVLFSSRFALWIKGVTNRPTDGRTNGRTDRRTNRRTDGWTDRQIGKASYRDAWTHFKMPQTIKYSFVHLFSE